MNKKIYFITVITILFLLYAYCIAISAEFRSFSDARPTKQAEQIQADIKLDFQYSNIQAATDNQTIHCAFEGKFRNKKNAPVELIVKNEITYSKTDDTIDNDRKLNNYQVNYFLKNPYVFFNVQTLSDLAMGIESEFSYGLGIGRKWDKISGQIGLYSTSNDDMIISRAELNVDLPLADQIALVMNDSGEIDLTYLETYRISSETALKINLTDSLDLKLGYVINYIKSNTDAIDTTKRYYTGLSYGF